MNWKDCAFWALVGGIGTGLLTLIFHPSFVRESYRKSRDWLSRKYSKASRRASKAVCKWVHEERRDITEERQS